VGVGLAVAGLLILGYATRLHRTGGVPASSPVRTGPSWAYQAVSDLSVLLPEPAQLRPAAANSARMTDWADLGR
jgi:DHA1 family inner membrane transport protein